MIDQLNWGSISVVLDVLIVAFVFYQILQFVRGTRALPMLAGLGILVLVYLAANKLHLVTLSFLLGQFLGAAILVIVVLFQEDLRRGLTKVGLIPGFAGHGPESLESTITEVARAASELAEKRIGALIVLKRDVGLEEYTEHAVKVGAGVSHQLLLSIFQPTSPLHDGAVIIDGDRIECAGAVLPLSFNASVSSKLGTRHRAALGLSEYTDAVIVAVSEETGSVSVVREGRITRDLNERSLYNALHRLTVFRQRRRLRKLRGLLWKQTAGIRDVEDDSIESRSSGEKSSG